MFSVFPLCLFSFFFHFPFFLLFPFFFTSFLVFFFSFFHFSFSPFFFFCLCLFFFPLCFCFSFCSSFSFLFFFISSFFFHFFIFSFSLFFLFIFFSFFFCLCVFSFFLCVLFFLLFLFFFSSLLHFFIFHFSLSFFSFLGTMPNFSELLRVEGLAKVQVALGCPLTKRKRQTIVRRHLRLLAQARSPRPHRRPTPVRGSLAAVIRILLCITCGRVPLTAGSPRIPRTASHPRTSSWSIFTGVGLRLRVCCFHVLWRSPSVSQTSLFFFPPWFTQRTCIPIFSVSSYPKSSLILSSLHRHLVFLYGMAPVLLLLSLLFLLRVVFLVSLLPSPSLFCRCRLSRVAVDRGLRHFRALLLESRLPCAYVFRRFAFLFVAYRQSRVRGLTQRLEKNQVPRKRETTARTAQSEFAVAVHFREKSLRERKLLRQGRPWKQCGGTQSKEIMGATGWIGTHVLQHVDTDFSINRTKKSQ